MYNPLKLFFTFFFLTFFSYSQIEITGIVKDSTNVIEFANVYITNHNNKLITGVTTNENGVFNLSIQEGDYKLIISFIGYEDWVKNILVTNSQNLGVITLIENKNELNEVVVTVNKPIFEKKFDKLIFNVENSPLKEGYDAVEVFKRSPKIQIDDDGNVLLRNQSSLILVNGRRLNLSGQELSSYLSALNSEDIKSIEIQDTGSSETDASNSGGVINVILKKSPKGFRSIQRFFYRYRDKSFDRYSSSISTKYGSNKWNIYSRISYVDDKNRGNSESTTNFFNTNDRNVDNTKFIQNYKSLNLNGGFVYYPSDKQEFGFEGYYNRIRRDNIFNSTINIFSPSIGAISDNESLTNVETDLWYTTLNYTFRKDSLGSTIKFIGDIGGNNFNNLNRVETIYSLGSNEDSDIRYTSQSKSEYYTLQLDWNQKFKSDLQLLSGLKFNSLKRNNELMTELFDGTSFNETDDGQQDFTNNEEVLAGYISLNTKLNDKQSVKVGIRLESTNIKGLNKFNNETVRQDYVDFFPSLYYGYSLQKEKTLSFSYSRRVSRPSFRDLNPFVLKVNDFNFQIGNPNLQPEYTNKFDITYQLKAQSYSIYGSYTNDLISGVYTVNEDNISFYQTQNFGNQKQFGADYSYYKNITTWLYLNISTGVYYYDFELQNLSSNQFSFYNRAQARFNLSKSLSFEIFNNYYHNYQYQLVSGEENYTLNLTLQKKLWDGKGLLKLYFSDVFNTTRDRNTSTFLDFNVDFFQKRLTQSFAVLFQFTLDNNKKVKNKSVKSDNDIRRRL